MLIVISPAKTLDYKSPIPAVRTTQPRLLGDSGALMNILRECPQADIAALMKVSDKIAALNARRFSEWQTPFNKDNARPAVFAFMGDVYTGLDAHSLSSKDLKQAQKTLRILSGLYGVLRPLDLMQPYRLEMGTRLNNPRGKDLYTFWGNQITNMINKDCAASASQVVVNLASNEYFRSVNTAQLDGQLITPVFQDEKGGNFKIISFYAKKARGLMAAWIIRNRIENVSELNDFNVAGYQYSARDSDGGALVFRRREKDIPLRSN